MVTLTHQPRGKFINSRIRKGTTFLKCYAIRQFSVYSESPVRIIPPAKALSIWAPGIKQVNKDRIHFVFLVVMPA